MYYNTFIHVQEISHGGSLKPCCCKYFSPETCPQMSLAYHFLDNQNLDCENLSQQFYFQYKTKK